MRLLPRDARLFVSNACLITTIVVASHAAGVIATPAFAQGVQCGPTGAAASPPPVRPPSVRGGGASGLVPSPGIAVQPACPSGQVPQVKALPPDSSGVMKGNPLLRPGADLRGRPSRGATEPQRNLAFEEVYGPQRLQTKDNPACDGIYHESEQACYYYATAAARRPLDGAGMTLTINRPRYVGVGGFGHTLAEMSFQGGEKEGDIIEIGWNVSTHQYDGSPDPHLFVFHWQNWEGTCYDSCGWVQVGQKFYPGQNLSALIGQEVSTGYVFHEGNWWAWFADEWIGYFPAEQWDGKFTQGKLVQWFGEVASRNGIPPQTEMGAGTFPTASDGARLRDLCDWDKAARTCTNRAEQSVAVHPEKAAKYYGATVVGASDVRYGGPGRELPVADRR